MLNLEDFLPKSEKGPSFFKYTIIIFFRIFFFFTIWLVINALLFIIFRTDCWEPVSPEYIPSIFCINDPFQNNLPLNILYRFSYLTFSITFVIVLIDQLFKFKKKHERSKYNITISKPFLILFWILVAFCIIIFVSGAWVQIMTRIYLIF